MHPEWQRERVPPSTHNGEYLARWTGTRFPPDEASWPVANVTWSAADAYCTAASKRLPTEQEWEWAARGGLDDPEFPWGNDAPDAMRANWAGAGIGHPTPVGSFAPNGYGLFDMAGNVWEFTSNAWPVDPGGLSTAGREGPGTRYAIRGGSYGAAPINLRVRYRDSHPAGGAGPHVGFRCAASPR